MITLKLAEKQLAPAGKSNRREGYTITLQTEWFQRNKGKVISVRLMDGTRISGLLEGWDTYTIAVRVSGREETVLVNKHGGALFMRREGEEKEKGG